MMIRTYYNKLETRRKANVVVAFNLRGINARGATASHELPL